MRASDIDKIQKQIQEQVRAGDAVGLENSLKSIFARIPYYLYEKAEAPYHAIFIVIMLFAGFKVQAEVATNQGRIDAVWEQENQTTVIEIKHSTEETPDSLIKEAFEQIKERKYYEPYLGKPISLLAIAFTSDKKEDRLTEIKCVFEEFKG
jgi:hypothetical protein